MTKTYTTKSNTKRAAVAAGLPEGKFEIVKVDGGFQFRALEAGAAVGDDDAGVPDFLKKGRPSLAAMAGAVEAGEVIDETAIPDDAVESALRRYIAADDRSDAWMRALLADVFEAGRASAKPTRAR
jgi:hypothetical protein